MSRGPEDTLNTPLTTDAALASLLRKAAHDSAPARSFPLPDVGTIVADKYVLEAFLGRGGMGAVYRARHRLTGKQFAIKLMLPNLTERPDAVQRFMREARVGGRFEHPNVVEVYDVGAHDKCHFIVMELVQGETLAERLLRAGSLSVRDACRLLIPLLRGVHAAHQAGVIHRDLKPHNIIISRDETGEELPKVVDFGISKLLPREELAQATETAEGTIIGTTEYMAPEQLRGLALDARVDVYASGVIAYQLLSGTLPFTATNRTDLVCKILSEPALPLQTFVATVPQELAALVAKAMERDADARFSSALDLARALEPFAGGMRFSASLVQDASASQQARHSPGSAVETRPVDAGGPTAFAAESRIHGRIQRSTSPRKRLLALAAVIAMLLGFAAYLASDRVGVGAHNAARPSAPRMGETDSLSEPVAPQLSVVPPPAAAAESTAPPAPATQPTSGRQEKKRSRPAQRQADRAPAPTPDPRVRPKLPIVRPTDFDETPRDDH